MEKISWTNRVRNEEVLHIVREERTFRCDIPVVFYRLNTIYITSSQNTTKFYCTVSYNMFYNYMFRPPFLGHRQVVSA